MARMVIVLTALACVFAHLEAEESAGTPQALKVVSTPVEEINVDKEYVYQVLVAPESPKAGLNYSLQKAPDGMTVSHDGIVKWSPRMVDIGDHMVCVRISDPRSSETFQYYFLTVTSPWTAQSKVRTLNYNDSKDAKRIFRVGILMINTMTQPVEDNPKSRQLEFYTPEKIGNLFFNHTHGSQAFIQEASYGRVALRGTVVGWLNAPKKDVNADDVIKESDYYFGLAHDYMDFSKYDVFIVHALVEGGGQQSGWLYPEQSVRTPQGIINNIGIIWMINSSVFDIAPLEKSYWSSGDSVLPTTSWAHEFLHTLGINGHANSYDCGDKTLSTVGAANPIKAYGNVYSIMGEHAFGCHPDVLMKSRLGWIDKQQFPTINRSGDYEIYPLETLDMNIKGLFIPVSTEITHESGKMAFDGFVVEYREPIGFDRYLGRLDGSPFLELYKPEGKVDRKGVMVYMKYKSDATDGTVLLDTNPGTSFNPKRGIKFQGNVGKFADAILPVNKTFIHNNISITPHGLTDKGAMRVKIEIGR